MCGICGIADLDVDAAEITGRMMAAMVHRGPDSQGMASGVGAAVGARRLRIIDLATGDQPVFSEDRALAGVFNGEIYNYRELRRELAAAGHVFVSRGDTEAIVHAYEEWGEGCLARLRGMFSLAILDRSAAGCTKLFLARDRLGIKPLYCYQAGRRFLFASEVRALLASGLVPRRLSVPGLYTYLAFGSLQEPLTCIEGVTSLPPATWLKVEVEESQMRLERGAYWQPPAQPGAGAVDIRTALAETVCSHLESEAPLGAFLSGGLDSGAVVAFASQALPGKLRTFTLGFETGEKDERRAAEETALRWGTGHQLRLLSANEVLADISQALAGMDQPTVDGINTWYVAREARRAGLTVALSGVGGDELFAGYPGFRTIPWLKRIPAAARRAAAANPWAERFLRPWISPDGWAKLVAYCSGDLPIPHPYFAVRGLFTGDRIFDLFQPAAIENLQAGKDGIEAWRFSARLQMERAASYDDVGEISWLELSQYTLSTLLRDTDMMSMAHSLEVRVPFLDHRLVEQVLPIAGARKLSGRGSKPLLAAALAGLLPGQVLAGPKTTFTIPFAAWLDHELAGMVASRLADLPPALQGLIRAGAAGRVWQDYRAGRTNWARPWALFVLFRWVADHL